jgi:CRISPR-associated endonuclease/helicase Cas3
MDHPWAKYDSPDEWHPLVTHSADVAAVLEALLRQTCLGARIARSMKDGLCETQIQRLCVLAALHDAGKANQGFQNRAFGKQPQDNHVTPMVGMLATNEKKRDLTETLGLQELLPWFAGQWSVMFGWLHTTWSHHGAPVAKEKPKKGRWTREAMERLAAFREWTRRWYPEAFRDAPPFATSQVQHLFNGVLTLADWIASDTTFFELTPDLTDPDDALDEAKKRARKAVRDLDLVPNRDVDSSLVNILGGHEPYDVQEKMQTLPTSPDGTLSILESATGSGKTEGALGRYARLIEEGLVDSMYFAVPTRAAAKQLHERVEEARDRIFGEDGPPVHLAVPGYLKVDDVEGTRFGWNVRWDEEIGPRGWAAESSKRYTASPIAVGTIDQVLLSALQIKHAHLRLAGLARSFLVVDEVHASSIYMNEALKQVLAFHCEMGGHALLMSATLGSETRASFIGEDVPSLSEAKRQHYPLISHVNGTEVFEPKKPEAPEGKGKEVSLSLEGIMKEEDAAAVAERAEEAARAGAHVLVIRNTVKACQAVHREISDDLSLCVSEKATPHHARYYADDRELLDDEVERVYGKHEEGTGEQKRIARKTDGHVVTVATQTVEQSLDIDADFLITDLCPMDVLLQRIGRLYRHDRPGDRPPGYQQARCLILTPATRDLTRRISEKSGFGVPGPGLGSVYDDLRIIEATWRALDRRVRENETLSIPQENRTLVEEATHPEVVEPIGEESQQWAAHARYLRTERREEMLGAKNVQVNRSQPFTSDDNQFPVKRPKTRLGDEDVVVELPTEKRTPFGKAVKELTLSPYFFNERPDDGVATDATDNPEGFTFSFANETFTYTRLGIQKA